MCFLVDVGDSLACPLMVRGRNSYLKLVLWTTQLSSLLKVVFKRGMNFLADTFGLSFYPHLRICLLIFRERETSICCLP